MLTRNSEKTSTSKLRREIQAESGTSDWPRGATGMRIIRAIIAGDRNPAVLATYRDVRCHSSIEAIRAALLGNDRDEHVFALTRAVELYDT